MFERHRCHREAIGSCSKFDFWKRCLGSMALGLKNSEPRCFACHEKLRPGPKASAPTGHCCRHLRAYGFPAGIADCLARKSSRERAARAKRMFSGPCSRPRDAIAKRSRFTVPFLVTDPHTKFQRLATNSARGDRPRTEFDFNIIMQFPPRPYNNCMPTIVLCKYVYSRSLVRDRRETIRRYREN